MARPVTITDEQILEAAHAVFVRDGVHATTKDIARQAKTSEGTIFRRFPTKEALFLAAVLNPPPPAWVRELDDLLGKGDLRANLVRIARGMVHFAQELLPLVVVAWGSKIDPEAVLAETAEPPAIRDRRRLAQFLRQEMDNGRLRRGNPEAAARLLFGGCVNLAMDQRPASRSLPADDVNARIDEMVDTLWSALCPDENPSAAGSERH